MAFEVTVPRFGWSMEKGTFVEWRMKDGERVSRGDILFVIEGDKAEQEVESLEAGTLRIAPGGPGKGDDVAVGTVLAWLLAPDEPMPAATEAAVPPRVTPSPAAPPAATPPPERTVCASPRARRLAHELGIDWKRLAGSGSTGRITERDVRAAASPAAGIVAGPAGTRAQLSVEADASSLARLLAMSGGSSAPPVPERSRLLARLVEAALEERCRLVGAEAPGAAGRLAVLDLGALGIDRCIPGSLPQRELLFSFGRIVALAGGAGPDPPCRMTVSLTYADGAIPLRVAAEKLARVREAVERPLAWLVR